MGLMKRHKILSYIAMMAFVTLGSCTKDFRSSQAEAPLSFAVSAEPFRTSTKAVAVNDMENFLTYCNPMHVLLLDNKDIHEFNVNYDSAVDRWIPEEEYIWRKGEEIVCFAVAPYYDTDNFISIEDDLEISIDMSVHQRDLMYAGFADAGNGDGVADFHFIHMFAAVEFVLDPSLASRLSVGKIEFRNICTTGKFTLEGWVRSDEPGSFTKYCTNDIFSSEDKTIMVIPQALSEDATFVLTASLDGAPEREYETSLAGLDWGQCELKRYKIFFSGDRISLTPVSVDAWNDGADEELKCTSPTSLIDGLDFNRIMIQAAGGASNIESVEFCVNSDITSAYEVQSFDSDSKVYVSFNSESRTLTVSTPSSELYLNPDASQMFANLTSLTSVDFGQLNTSLVRNLSYFFYGCSYLPYVDYSSFNTPDLTNVAGMHGWCFHLETVTFGPRFTTSNVTNMCGMFGACNRLSSLDLSGFDTSKVTTFKWLFESCFKLTEIQGIENFDTSSATDMSYMFSNCDSLTELDLSSFDTYNVRNMDYMLGGTNLTELILGYSFVIPDDCSYVSFLPSEPTQPCSVWALTSTIQKLENSVDMEKYNFVYLD